MNVRPHRRLAAVLIGMAAAAAVLVGVAASPASAQLSPAAVQDDTLGAAPAAPAPPSTAAQLADQWSAEPARQGEPGPFRPQIVGGQAAATVPAGSVALIHFGTVPNLVSCSGVLVAPQWVLTAAHCAVEYSNGAPTRTTNDPALYGVYVGTGSSGTKFLVNEVRLNDDYQRRTSSEDVPGYRNAQGAWIDGAPNVANDTSLDDYALLHLTLPSGATPLPLAVDDSLSQAGNAIWVAGWGVENASTNTLPSSLREVQMTIGTSTYCEVSWRQFFSATANLCYSSPTAATCSGDSGGPVMNRDEDGTWWVIGIVFGGSGNCAVGSAYVGVRSGWLAPWVAAVTGVAQTGRYGESFNPVVPTRIVDSRSGQGVSFIPPTIFEPASQGVFLPIPTLSSGFVTRRPIIGASGVPGLPSGGVAGVVLNVTVEGQGGGYVAAYPCLDGWTGTSSVNFAAGQTVANLVVVKVDRNGDVCFRAAAETTLIVDLTGWLGATTPTKRAVDASDPVRLFDSRDAPNSKLPNGGTAVVQVTGPGRAPVGARAAVLNITSTAADANGFVTAWPCDAARPLASSLNPVRGRDVPNSVIVQLDGSGRVCLYTELATHLVVDLNGWVVDAGVGTVKTVTPARLVDTRDNGVRVAGGAALIVGVAGRGGVPASGLDSVVLNVTVTDPVAAGYLVVYPCGGLPNASNLNFVAGQSVPNGVVAKVDWAGNVCLWSTTATHLVVDVVGYVRT